MTSVSNLHPTTPPPDAHSSGVTEASHPIAYLGDEAFMEWLRALVGTHDVKNMAPRVEFPERFVDDFITAAATSIADWPHQVHMPASSPKVMQA
jgi:hypothetical protein